MEKKVFEDEFSSIQVDMIQICMEYAYDKAEKIYIYVSYESKTTFCDYFYKMNGEVIKRSKLNEFDATCDVSIKRQEECLDILFEDIKKLKHLCKEYDMEMPTEIKLTYDVINNQVSAGYSYDLMYSKDPELTGHDIAEQWFEQVKKSEQETTCLLQNPSKKK